MKSVEPGKNRETDSPTVQERLARVQQAIARVDKRSEERTREVLERRARALARVPQRGIVTSEVLEVAIFKLGAERFGIEARFIREVGRLRDFTPVPGLPDFVVGVTNLRGEVLAVVDLCRFIGIPRIDLTDLSRLIVLGEEAAEFGVLADETYEVADIAAGALHPPPALLRGLEREFVRGVTEDALIILDGRALLRDPRLFFDQGDESGRSGTAA